ncbi:hypothetical protein KUTeg_021763 [Tegillarca granosa]|uniref:ubiquitinyl hydrolase 1 n=1 Tax=Tegillarca granosa TaxID=220873 RepID=A0ABQ9E4A3_TEGGR|nr:hypothetical protein KUTeg_021763 [Tegillarca granosa]
MATSAGDWCLIESDPGVFTELIRGFGCNGVQVEEIWSLDPEIFENLKQQMFEFDEKMAKKDDDVFHFVGYLPIDGRLYELDGLKDGPVDLGPVSADGDWLDVVRPVLEKRMQKYSTDEIHFNLMAIVSDRKSMYERRIQELTTQIEDSGMETDSVQSQINQLHLLIQDEELKMKRYKVENIRRKHNYLPFIMELLKILAEHGQLLPLVEKAKEKAAKKKEEKEKKEQAKQTS